MRVAAILAASVVLSAAAPEPRLTEREFQQLMEAAVVASKSELPLATKTICVRSELDAPFNYSKPLRTFSDPAIGKAMDTALASTTVVNHARIRAVPPRFVLFASDAAIPPACVIQHLPDGAENENDSSVVLRFTHPALANGYAFVEEYEECPGLCGNTFLRVFRNRNGKWLQVDRAGLSVS